MYAGLTRQRVRGLPPRTLRAPCYLGACSVSTPCRVNQLTQPCTGSSCPASLPLVGVLGGLAVTLAVNWASVLPLCACKAASHWPRALLARGALNVAGRLTTSMGLAGAAGAATGAAGAAAVAALVLAFAIACYLHKASGIAGTRIVRLCTCAVHKGKYVLCTGSVYAIYARAPTVARNLHRQTARIT